MLKLFSSKWYLRAAPLLLVCILCGLPVGSLPWGVSAWAAQEKGEGSVKSDEEKDPQAGRAAKEAKDVKEVKEIKESSEVKDGKDTKDSKDAQEVKEETKNDKEGRTEDSPARTLKGNDKQPLVVTSDSLLSDSGKKTAVFTGHVKAVKGDVTFVADKMVVFYDDKNKIQHIDADGNIKLVRGGKTVTSQKAVYYAENEHVVFTGKPEATDGKNVITGTKMTYYMKDDRSVVENSKVFLVDK